MKAFVTRFAMALPVAFVAWYALMPFASAPLAWLSAHLVEVFTPAAVAASSGAAGAIFKAWTYADNAVTQVVTDVRLYSWGLPLAVALLVACAPRRAAPRLGAVLGTAIIVVVWGMGFDVLAQLLRDAPEVLRPLSSAKANLIAIGYQVGSLVLPGLAPCVVAIMVCREDLVPLLVTRRPGVA